VRAEESHPEDDDAVIDALTKCDYETPEGKRSADEKIVEHL